MPLLYSPSVLAYLQKMQKAKPIRGTVMPWAGSIQKGGQAPSVQFGSVVVVWFRVEKVSERRYRVDLRYYDPNLGRFISADTYVDGPDDTQGYGRYTYVRNNPVNLSDRSGHFWFIFMLPTIIATIANTISASMAAGHFVFVPTLAISIGAVGFGFNASIGIKLDFGNVGLNLDLSRVSATGLVGSAGVGWDIGKAGNLGIGAHFDIGMNGNAGNSSFGFSVGGGIGGGSKGGFGANLGLSADFNYKDGAYSGSTLGASAGISYSSGGQGTGFYSGGISGNAKVNLDANGKYSGFSWGAGLNFSGGMSDINNGKGSLSLGYEEQYKMVDGGLSLAHQGASVSVGYNNVGMEDGVPHNLGGSVTTSYGYDHLKGGWDDRPVVKGGFDMSSRRVGPTDRAVQQAESEEAAKRSFSKILASKGVGLSSGYSSVFSGTICSPLVLNKYFDLYWDLITIPYQRRVFFVESGIDHLPGRNESQFQFDHIPNNVFGARVIVTDDWGNVLWDQENAGSTLPESTTHYAKITAGKFTVSPYLFHGYSALILNGGGLIPIVQQLNPNIPQNGQYADAVFIHQGQPDYGSGYQRGSKACLTIRPEYWGKFISYFSHVAEATLFVKR